jgi:predicted nucleic acid-binding protein
VNSVGGYLLDTNIISETRRKRPFEGVVDFLATADDEALFLSVVTLGELRKGLQAKRRTDPAVADELAGWVDGIEQLFADRILPIDVAAARLWGELSAARSAPVVDMLIAATAITRGLTLVTRNVRDFQVAGASLIDPWDGRDG